MAGSGVTRLFIVGERRITICPAVQRDRTTRSLSSGAHSRDPLASLGGRRTASGDAIASVARMSEAIDGRHEKNRRHAVSPPRSGLATVARGGKILL
jgi:hypothetical protein